MLSEEEYEGGNLFPQHAVEILKCLHSNPRAKMTPDLTERTLRVTKGFKKPLNFFQLPTPKI